MRSALVGHGHKAGKLFKLIPLRMEIIISTAVYELITDGIGLSEIVNC